MRYRTRLVLQVTGLLASAIIILSTLLAWRERTHALGERTKQLESLSNKLSKYLSPQLYTSIFQGRQEVEIASTRKKLTVFSSDLVGFTETTENLESEELTGILNRYLNGEHRAQTWCDARQACRRRHHGLFWRSGKPGV